MQQGYNALQGTRNDKNEPTDMQQGHSGQQGAKHDNG